MAGVGSSCGGVMVVVVLVVMMPVMVGVVVVVGDWAAFGNDGVVMVDFTDWRAQ